MSLHVGNDFVLSSKQIVAVLKWNSNEGDVFYKGQANSQVADRVRKIGTGPYRAAVLCTKGTLYLSPSNVTTLVRRLNKQGKFFMALEE